jgi:cell fate (sporulation/competence/biofilm development) regulator YlbF (YheA/YmcA/DUF963 family)
METTTTQMSLELTTAAQTLAESLAASEPILRYQQANKILDGDSTARELLQRLSVAQADLRDRQLRGTLGQVNIDQLLAVQSEAQANPIILEFAQSQQAAIAYLREINQDISQLIGLDFAKMSRRSSCC